MEAWQLDPYRWADQAEVLSCEPQGKGWAVRTTPTILFPEGGGQPADHGTIGGVAVTDVRKASGGPVHLTVAPVPLGPAEVRVDGARRLDHMQQHTGQHLLTATLIERFDVGTTSFHLGPEHAAIELDAPELSAERMRETEELVNAAIREARPVSQIEVDAEEMAALGVRSRGLPEGFEGRVRLVRIDGVDLNTCGGTHVRHLGELGVLQLVGVEGVGARGCRLYFLVGGRVRRRLRELLEREAAMNRLLSTGPESHGAAITRLAEERRELARRVEILEDAAVEQQAAALAGSDGPHVVVLPGATMRMLQSLASRLALVRPTAAVVAAAPEADGRQGSLLVAGPAAAVAALAGQVIGLTEARGGGRGRWQGRALRLDRLSGWVPR